MKIAYRFLEESVLNNKLKKKKKKVVAFMKNSNAAYNDINT